MRTLSILTGFLLLASVAPAKELIQLANNPALSPDGQTLAFDWNGDLWTVPVNGGVARQLTFHPSRDLQPKFSPDGKEIAFTSDREGTPQVYVIPTQGGTPTQLAFHTAGYTLHDWTPDGKALLVSGQRDHYWRHAERFFRIDRAERKAEQVLFDDYGSSGQLSPDGGRLLFTREGGTQWWRKGYKGSNAGQVWMCDLNNKNFRQVVTHDMGCLWPLWKPDGHGLYFVCGAGGCFNLWEHNLEKGANRQLTKFPEDSVVFPCISRDGSTIVFRHLFDFYRYHPGRTEPPTKIEVFHDTDRAQNRTDRRVLTQASQVAFTHDALEVAFISGGDLWVMDTELREPRQITNTGDEERHPVFSPGGDSIFFVSDKGGQCDIWKAERADRAKFWWQNDTFNLTRITNDAAVESALKWSPDGSRLAYSKGRGDLCVMNADGTFEKTVLKGWNPPEFDWSPDGRWMVYAQYDQDFNRDIYITPLDGSRPPFNLSRNPYNEGNPVWSPDGKVIAFTGKRSGSERDIWFVYLRAEDDEKGSRDRSLEKALDKFTKTRQPAAGTGGEDAPKVKPGVVKKAKAEPVVIDFDRVHERIRRAVIGDSGVSGLFWSPDSKKLAFNATIDGRRGTYTIDIPDNTRPTLLTTQTGTQARWLRQTNQIVWLSNGLPAAVAGTPRPTMAATTTPAGPVGKGIGRGPTSPTAAPASTGDAEGGSGYRFQALQEVNLSEKYAAAFDLSWRTMRDTYYDERLGNRAWDTIRLKYRDLAKGSTDVEMLSTVINLMLGELNGSHLGFTPLGRGTAGPPGRRGPGPAPAADPAAERSWTVTTAHLGVRFDPNHKGPGLRVRDVILNGPADQKKSRLQPGEVILSIDGVAVNPTMDLTTVLNGPATRDIKLKVRGADEKERDVVLRPTSYTQVRTTLYEMWLKHNRTMVEKSSKGTLGYLHISGMNMPSFHRFEEELYSVGAGKDGIVIDVRENGGGSTTDHLLTVLTQPIHAVTVPRGGGPGYPQDRKVYATWNKPIIVLCNQNSFSNAEIFSHAIKVLKRGQLVGVPTAGGVISTGAATIMDLGVLRQPGRGWYLIDTGEDMELNGAVPHHVLWPKPGDLPAGKDEQLAKAVEVLLKDVQDWRSRPLPKLRKATER